MTDTIAADLVVGLNYILRNEAGETLDESAPGDPLFYLHGHDNIVPGLERKLTGKKVGEKMVVVVQPADGYGERDSRATQKVPRDAFPKDVELEVGMQLAMRDPSGDVMPLWIAGVAEDGITIDLNHPLAGVVLHFDVEVLSIRDASKAELEHGHPHGPDGHGHHH